MKYQALNKPRQKGVVLVIGLVMLVLITLMVTTSFRLSSTNLQAVGNLQFRNQAVAAAGIAIESSFGLTDFPHGNAVGVASSPRTFAIDIERTGVNKYSVAVTRTCLRAAASTSSIETGYGSSVTLGEVSTIKEYVAMWDYDATVTDNSTGASARVRQGVRERLSQSQCNTLCPPSASLSCS